MAGLSITGQMKVSTLQEGFLKEFGLTLRVYDGREFADPSQTLGQVRKKKGSGKALSVAKNMKVGNLEDKFEEEFGLKVQVAGSDDSYLCDNNLTLNAARQEDGKKAGRKERKAERQEAAGDDGESGDDENENDTSTGDDSDSNNREEIVNNLDEYEEKALYDYRMIFYSINEEQREFLVSNFQDYAWDGSLSIAHCTASQISNTVDAPEDTTPAERRTAMTWLQRLKRPFKREVEPGTSIVSDIEFKFKSDKIFIQKDSTDWTDSDIDNNLIVALVGKEKFISTLLYSSVGLEDCEVLFIDQNGDEYDMKISMGKSDEAIVATNTKKNMSGAAQFDIGQNYYHGRDVEENHETAAEWFTLSAEQGYAYSQYNLGVMYRQGQGVPQDDETSLKWFRLCAEQEGLRTASAQYNVGVMYRDGEGVPQNEETAVEWFTLAAGPLDPTADEILEKPRSVDAQYNLGVMYRQGRGVSQDYETAAKWFTLAAKEGDAYAQYELGGMYALGQGVPQDYANAYAFLDIAGSNGHEQGEEKRDLVAKEMTPADITAAKKLARDISVVYSELEGIKKAMK